MKILSIIIYPALSESNGIETKPAWTVNFSKRNSTVLDKFKIDQVLNEMMWSPKVPDDCLSV